MGPFTASSNAVLQSAVAAAFAMPLWAVALITVDVVTYNDLDPAQPRTLWGWRVAFAIDASEALLSPVISERQVPGSGLAGLPSAVDRAVNDVVIPTVGNNAAVATALDYPSTSALLAAMFPDVAHPAILLLATASPSAAAGDGGGGASGDASAEASAAVVTISATLGAALLVSTACALGWCVHQRSLSRRFVTVHPAPPASTAVLKEMRATLQMQLQQLLLSQGLRGNADELPSMRSAESGMGKEEWGAERSSTAALVSLPTSALGSA